MNLIRELMRIGKNEINFSISYFYDDIWIFKLGDDLNSFTWEESFKNIVSGVNNLIYEIIKQFPDSDYVKELKKRSDSVFQGLDFFHGDFYERYKRL
ncbi:hypothetical protein LCGC14_0371560 [marine sediment metagenome]|uniref:Uncharacterized protein n=1 Tax=marine sediment metagenome TaxID=412755 RepID=A0A0F9TAX7_9ZZZZ